MIMECIKEGFYLANKNLQLVLLRLIVTIINLTGFFVFLGLPIVIAAAYFGLDLANASDLLPFVVESPFEFISKYLGLIFLIGTSFVFYLTLSSLLILYALSGSLGMLKNAVVHVKYRFSLHSFFKEAKKNFSRLLRLLSLVLLGIMVILIAIITSGGIVATLVHTLAGKGSTLEMFFSSFVVISIAVFGSVILVAGLILVVYSIVASVIEEKGATDSVKKAYDFLKGKPAAFLFYIVLIAGIITANVIYYTLQVSLQMVPVLGSFLSVASFIINAFFQSYLALVVWSALIIYYMKGTNYPISSASYEI
jgi:hypothetical protein